MSLEWKNQLQIKGQLNEACKKLGLPPGSQLYGRDVKVGELLKCLTFPKDPRSSCEADDFSNPKAYTNISLVGVYGMTGIGKSYLVKHVALKMMTDKKNGSSILYTDASGITTLSDVLVKLLQNPEIDLFASGSQEHMMGLLRDYFTSNKHKSFILIIDDLSSLLDGGQSEEVKTFLNFLLKTKRKNSLKVKVVVTSQVELKDIGEEDEQTAVKSLSLSTLNMNDAKELLDGVKTKLDETQKEMIVKECHGHPFTLYVVREMLSAGVDIAKYLEDIASIKEHNETDKLFKKALARLSELQQKVLLACCLFESDVNLEVLHELLGEKGSRVRFRKTITAEFSIRFWLSFKSVANEKEWISKARRSTLVKTYHPLVKQFLQRLYSETIANDLHPMHSAMLQTKEKFITHQVSNLISIGKDCLQNPQRACQDFLRQKVNIKAALADMADLNAPELLLATKLALNDDESIYYFRSLEDIFYIFLSLHQYYDSFDGKLLDCLVSLSNLCSKKECDSTYQVLMHTLHMLIIMRQKDWKTLDDIVHDTKFARTIPESDGLLLNLNAVMTFYIQSKLYTSAPKYMDIAEGDLFEKRNEVLSESLSMLETFPRRLNNPCKYFAVQIMMIQAEAEWLGIPDLERIRTARSICEKAEEYANHASILKPMAVLETATYLKLEGIEHCKDKTRSADEKAEKLYERSLKAFAEVVTEYERRRMDTSTEGAKAYMGIAMVYICLGNCLVRDVSSSAEVARKERLMKAVGQYKDAVCSLESASRAFTVLNSASKLELVKSIALKAEALEQLVIALNKFKPSDETDIEKAKQIKHSEQLILQALAKSYNYFLTDPDHCDLKPGDPTYNRIFGIISILEKYETLYTPETVRRVKTQLKTIEDNFKRKKADKAPKEVDRGAVLRELYTDEEVKSTSAACCLV